MPDLIKDVIAKGGHETLLSGVAFKGEKELKDEEYLKALCPDTDATFLGHLSNAVKEEGWKTDLEGANEYELFLAQYKRIAQFASRRLGVTALEMYERYQKVVEAAVLYITSEGTETGHFFGARAKMGSIQWMVRPICYDSFPTKVTAANLIYDPLLPGDKGVVERKNDGAPADGYKLKTDKQILCIFGYVSNLNPRVIARLQEEVNDGVGKRMPIEVYEQMALTDIGLVPRTGCLVVNEAKTLKIGCTTLVAADFDIMPFGVDITTADNVTAIM